MTAPSQAPPRVLVVDDDRAVRESLRRSLEFNGYAVRLAELAGEVGLPVERKAPVGHKDWDAVLKARGVTPARPERPRASSALAAVVRAMQPPEPTGPMPWTPAPVSLAERVRAFEERDALRAAAAMAARGRAEAPASLQPEVQQRRPSLSPGAAP